MSLIIQDCLIAPNGDEEGFVRNQEPRYYTRKRLANGRVENGCLVIETKKEEYPNNAYRQDSTGWKRKEKFAHYTSASINSRQTMTMYFLQKQK
jgi:hypothetical protein